MDYSKLKELSDNIVVTISDKVEKATGHPLVQEGKKDFFHDTYYDTQVLRLASKHNGRSVIYLVAFQVKGIETLTKESDKYKNQINYVSRFIIEFVNNKYKYTKEMRNGKFKKE